MVNVSERPGQPRRCLARGTPTATRDVMRTPDYDVTERLWAFVRGDAPAAEFETWIYSEPRLEGELGEELYLQTD